jgi:hypothetical protein
MERAPAGDGDGDGATARGGSGRAARAGAGARRRTLEGIVCVCVWIECERVADYGKVRVRWERLRAAAVRCGRETNAGRFRG